LVAEAFGTFLVQVAELVAKKLFWPVRHEIGFN
jgi:hypothetical protein